jgi:hypothetical protein
MVIFVTPEIVRPEESGLSEREQLLFERGIDRRNRIADKVEYDLMD